MAKWYCPGCRDYKSAFGPIAEPCPNCCGWRVRTPRKKKARLKAVK